MTSNLHAEMVAEATRLADKGLVPIVQTIELDARGKKRVSASMRYAHLQTADMKAIKAFLVKNPAANALGILMGHDYVNIDFDCLDAYRAFVADGLIGDADTEQTRITKTASGKYHYIYILPEGWTGKYIKTICAGNMKVDVLFGTNNVELVYPTTLPNGTMYTHCGTPDPSVMPDHLRLYLEPLLAHPGQSHHSAAVTNPRAEAKALHGTYVVHPPDRLQRHRWTRAVFPLQPGSCQQSVIPVLDTATLRRYIPPKRTPKATWISTETAASILEQYSVVAVSYHEPFVDWVHFAPSPSSVDRDILLLLDDGLLVRWVLATRVSGSLVSTTGCVETRRYDASAYRDPEQLWDLDLTMPLYPGLWTMAPRKLGMPVDFTSSIITAAATEYVTTTPITLEKDVIKVKMVFPDPAETLRQTSNGELWRYMHLPGDDGLGYVTTGSWDHPALGALVAKQLCFNYNGMPCIPVVAFARRNLGLRVGGMACTAAEVCVAAAVDQTQANAIKIAASLDSYPPTDSTAKAIACAVAKAREDARIGTSRITYHDAPECVKRMMIGEFLHDKRWTLAKVLGHTARRTGTVPILLRDMFTAMIQNSATNKGRVTGWHDDFRSNALKLDRELPCHALASYGSDRLSCPFAMDFPHAAVERCLSTRRVNGRVDEDMEDWTPARMWACTKPMTDTA